MCHWLLFGFFCSCFFRVTIIHVAIVQRVSYTILYMIVNSRTKPTAKLKPTTNVTIFFKGKIKTNNMLWIFVLNWINDSNICFTKLNITLNEIHVEIAFKLCVLTVFLTQNYTFDWMLLASGSHFKHILFMNIQLISLLVRKNRHKYFLWSENRHIYFQWNENRACFCVKNNLWFWCKAFHYLAQIIFRILFFVENNQTRHHHLFRAKSIERIKGKKVFIVFFFSLFCVYFFREKSDTRQQSNVLAWQMHWYWDNFQWTLHFVYCSFFLFIFNSLRF